MFSSFLQGEDDRKERNTSKICRGEKKVGGGGRDKGVKKFHKSLNFDCSFIFISISFEKIIFYC